MSGFLHKRISPWLWPLEVIRRLALALRTLLA